MEITINEAMVKMKVLKGRLGELSHLRHESSTREVWREPNRVIEPVYDMKELDRRCTEIENALLEMETAIKQSNAITKIKVDADIKALLTPLK
jgi:hypothetical protein